MNKIYNYSQIGNLKVGLSICCAMCDINRYYLNIVLIITKVINCE